MTVGWLASYWLAIVAWLIAAAALATVVVGFFKGKVWAVGFGMLGAAGLVLYLLFSLWPVRVSDLAPSQSPDCGCVCASAAPAPVPTVTLVPAPPPGANPRDLALRAAITSQLNDPWVRCAKVFGWTFPLPFELRLLIIVALAAALGAFVHVATSFTDFLGNGAYNPRWLWWYVLRIPVGIALAFTFYFAIRGGILTTTSLSTTDINPFGIAAIAGLVGLFSKQASDKLAETFSTIFKTDKGGDAARGGKIDSIVPTIDTVKIDKGNDGDKAPQAYISGSNFKDDVKVAINGADLTGAIVADSKDDRNLTVAFDKAELAKPKLKVEVKNDTPAGSASAIKEIDV